ncbi:MAG: HAMP domain-containing histidine kinase [Clostridia bacterium]|nr:HAMP domain-containing histidine kinase [Clostridia bacterium]
MIKELIDKIKKYVELIRREFGSLNVALIASLMIGLAFSVVAYFSVNIVSTAVIENVYLAEDAKAERAREYAAELQEYIDENGITAEKSDDSFAQWIEDNKYVFLMVNHIEDVPEGSLLEYGSLEAYAEAHKMHVITTYDGVKLLVSVGDFTETFYYELFNIIEFALAVVILFAIMLAYVQKVTGRIKTLAEEVSLVSGGDTARVVNIKGYDEITDLSKSVEQMRVSILAKIESEKAALDANSELIKSMSHDIRTPLTVLLGYIDMMKERAEEDPTMKEYVLASEKTAMRLKRLSDDLFSYFLLFGQGTEVNLDNYNFGFLIDQMLAEYMLLSSERGYNVEMRMTEEAGNVEISTDPDLLMRVIENLFSNMFKYADADKPITVDVTVDGEICKVIFTNTIDRSGNKVETNGIGLKSCRKIADTLGFGLEFGATEDDADIYVTTLSFKIAEKKIEE